MSVSCAETPDRTTVTSSRNRTRFARSSLCATVAALVAACCGISAHAARVPVHGAGFPGPDWRMLGLTREPYLGVACRAPNTTTCGRIGIAVWLTRAPISVDAAVAGKTVRLSRTGAPYLSAYIHADIGLPPFWTGSRTMSLRLVIRDPHRTVRGTIRVTLHPGWG
jgi:hypothetical protein